MEVLPEVSFEHSIPCEVVILSHVFLVSTASAQEFCSVGDDSCLILWDTRVGSSPAVKVIFLISIFLVSLLMFEITCKFLFACGWKSFISYLVKPSVIF